MISFVRCVQNFLFSRFSSFSSVLVLLGILSAIYPDFSHADLCLDNLSAYSDTHIVISDQECIGTNRDFVRGSVVDYEADPIIFPIHAFYFKLVDGVFESIHGQITMAVSSSDFHNYIDSTTCLGASLGMTGTWWYNPADPKYLPTTTTSRTFFDMTAPFYISPTTTFYRADQVNCGSLYPLKTWNGGNQFNLHYYQILPNFYGSVYTTIYKVGYLDPAWVNYGLQYLTAVDSGFKWNDGSAMILCSYLGVARIAGYTTKTSTEPPLEPIPPNPVLETINDDCINDNIDSLLDSLTSENIDWTFTTDVTFQCKACLWQVFEEGLVKFQGDMRDLTYDFHLYSMFSYANGYPDVDRKISVYVPPGSPEFSFKYNDIPIALSLAEWSPFFPALSTAVSLSCFGSGIFIVFRRSKKL